MRINNERSSLQNIISGVPQNSIVGHTLLTYFQRFFVVYLIAQVHNFTDDNSFSNIATTVDSLQR